MTTQAFAASGLDHFHKCTTNKAHASFDIQGKMNGLPSLSWRTSPSPDILHANGSVYSCILSKAVGSKLRQKKKVRFSLSLSPKLLSISNSKYVTKRPPKGLSLDDTNISDGVLSSSVSMDSTIVKYERDYASSIRLSSCPNTFCHLVFDETLEDKGESDDSWCLDEQLTTPKRPAALVLINCRFRDSFRLDKIQSSKDQCPHKPMRPKESRQG
jgi:hypothetical protein